MNFYMPLSFEYNRLSFKRFRESIVRIVKLRKRDRRAFPIFGIQTVLLIALLYTRGN